MWNSISHLLKCFNSFSITCNWNFLQIETRYPNNFIRNLPTNRQLRTIMLSTQRRCKIDTIRNSKSNFSSKTDEQIFSYTL